MQIIARRLTALTAAVVITGAAVVTAGTQALPAFERNMASLAAVEGITPATVGRLRTVDGLHLPGPDAKTGFDAVLAAHKPPHYDADGIPMVVYGKEFVGEAHAGAQYNPVTIAAAALDFVRYRNDPRAAIEVSRYLDFLLRYGKAANNGSLLLPYKFDSLSTNSRAPWYSAMAQAVAASAFLWGHRLTGDDRYLMAAVSLVVALEQDIRPPFLVPQRRGQWPKEYPSWQYTVLDGALATLIGIWDLAQALPAQHPQRARIVALKASVTAGILGALPCFKSAAFGHFYADAGYSLGPGYHRTNIRLLSYLGGLDPAFAQFAEAFSIADRSILARTWHAAVITGHDFLVNRGLIARSRPPCVTASADRP